MAGGTFAKRIRELNDSTPTRLTGEVIRDQVYAQYQHENGKLRHPNGGQWKYQSTALYSHYREYLERVARALLRGETVDAMSEAMEMFGEDSGELAPKDYEVLANSDRQRVVADGRIVRDVPPLAPRMTDEEMTDRNSKSIGRYAAQTGPHRSPPPGARVTQKPRPYND